MTLGDLRDLFAYLGTLPAVSGRAPAHRLAFPYSIRRGIGLWKRAFFDITRKTLGDWSVKDIAYLLQGGMTPDGDFVVSSMADVTANTGLIGDADRLAIATYIKSLPPVEGPPKPKDKPKQ